MTTRKGKKLDIVTYPNPILRQRCNRVEDINSEEIQQLLADMEVTMKSADGIGLAAPQVGVNLDIFLASDGRKTEAFINPVILFKSFRRTPLEEGCLSLPGISAIVKRPHLVVVLYRNRQGKWRLKVAGKLLAKVIQHEFDHLRGVLIIDKYTVITQGKELVEKFND